MSNDIEQYVDVGNPDFDPTNAFTSGCPDRDDNFGDNFGTFAANVPTIPRDQWYVMDKDKSMRSMTGKAYNQSNEGTCTANQTAKSGETFWFMQLGVRIPFSPISIYKQCGRSPNSGSSVTCCMRTARDRGMLPTDTPENRAQLRGWGLDPNHVMDHVGFHQRYPDGWEETAQFFKIDETYDIANFDEFASALLAGYLVSYGRSGHSILGVRLVKHNGQWAVEYLNSWGNWGYDNGFGIDTESYLRGAIRQYGAIATRNVKIPDFASGGSSQ